MTLPPPPTPAPLEPPTPAPYTPVPTPAPYETPPTPAPYETPSNYASFGCYADSSRDRVLTGSSKKGVEEEMTTEVGCFDIYFKGLRAIMALPFWWLMAGEAQDDRWWRGG